MTTADTQCEHLRHNRRTFLNHSAVGIGTIALASLASGENDLRGSEAGHISAPPFQPKAKRVIYLFQSGGPSQLDLFDYKPDYKSALARKSRRRFILPNVKQQWHQGKNLFLLPPPT